MVGFLERNVTTEILFTGITANGVYTYSKTSAAQSNIKIQVTGAAGAAYTIRVRGTTSQVAPDFTLADSPNNPWSYIQLRNNDTGNYITGNVGITVAANGTVQLDLNTDIITYFAVEISGYASGNATGIVTLTNNT